MTHSDFFETSRRADGLQRSVDLMQSLGPRAEAVWAHLDPDVATRLRSAMSSSSRNHTSNGAPVRDDIETENRTPVWDRLADLPSVRLARLLDKESPQMLALVLARLPAAAAAGVVKKLPVQLASTALHRLANLGPVNPAVAKRLAETLDEILMRSDHAKATDGVDQVAEILDQMPGKREQALLKQLDTAEQGLLARLQARMFRFPDLARLDGPSMQTLLAKCDRDILLVAMTGADAAPVLDHVAQNMTQRAASLLRSEIEAGPVPDRQDIEAARLAMIGLVRSLARSGDILIGSERRRAGAR